MGPQPGPVGDFPEHWGYQDLFANDPNVKLIVVDPRCTEYSPTPTCGCACARHDGAMAMGWMNVIINEDLYDHEFVDAWTYGFDKLKEAVQAYPPEKVAEICWVSADKIVEAARIFATCLPAYLPWGLATDAIGRNQDALSQSKACLKALIGINKAGQTYLAPPNDTLPHATFEMPEMLPKSQRDKQLGSDRFPFHSWPSYQMISDAQSRVFHHPYFLSPERHVRPELVRRQRGHPHRQALSGQGPHRPGVEPVLQPVQHP